MSVTVMLGAALALAACVPPEPGPPPPAPVPPAPIARGADGCGAGALQSLLGAPVGSHDFSRSGRVQRIMREGSAMTMDYRPDRLNVTYDSRGRITRIWCG